MLGKLFKHEMKACARLLLPLYLVLAVLTVLDRIVLNLNIFTGVLNLIPGFITFAYVMLIIATIVVSFVIIVLRFYRNLMTDEGYLMFTLPVKPHQLINSKLIASILWSASSILVIVVSLFGVFATPDTMDKFWAILKEAFSTMRTELGSQATLFLIEMLILIIIGYVNNILHIYASIAIGQLFNGHKVLGAFGAYIGINIVVQIISSFFILIATLIFRRTFEDISAIPQLLFPLTILFLLVFNFVYYFATDYIFKKKLNID